jgi:hypothetical protein
MKSIGFIFRVYIYSWDTVLSAVAGLLCFFLLPKWVSNTFCVAIYSTGISVLSIVFSIFFASLSVIMTSSDNEFVKFLEQKRHYSNLIGTFQFTLFSLFLALVYSLLLYTITSYSVSNPTPTNKYQSTVWFIIFSVLTTYSLIATFFSVKDTFMFAIRRVTFLNFMSKKADAQDDKKFKL